MPQVPLKTNYEIKSSESFKHTLYLSGNSRDSVLCFNPTAGLSSPLMVFENLEHPLIMLTHSMHTWFMSACTCISQRMTHSSFVSALYLALTPLECSVRSATATPSHAPQILCLHIRPLKRELNSFDVFIPLSSDLRYR